MGDPASCLHPSTISGGNVPSTLPNIAPKLNKRSTVIPGSLMLRKLLPIALCLITFATVMTMLLVYMDTTALRHQQFRINMTLDYDLMNVAQDNPQLITYIREVHLRGNTNNHVQEKDSTHNSSDYERIRAEPVDRIAYVVKLLSFKKNGLFVESLSPGVPEGARYLCETLGWNGLIVEPDPRKYFTLRKHLTCGGSKTILIHACLSPTSYPKEVSLHRAEFNDGVRINSILDSDTDWFNSRVKCFPLYSLLLAINSTTIDLLSISSESLGLHVLSTIPFDRVKINVIDIHIGLLEDFDATQNITKFLTDKLTRGRSERDEEWHNTLVQARRDPTYPELYISDVQTGR